MGEGKVSVQNDVTGVCPLRSEHFTDIHENKQCFYNLLIKPHTHTHTYIHCISSVLNENVREYHVCPSAFSYFLS